MPSALSPLGSSLGAIARGSSFPLPGSSCGFGLARGGRYQVLPRTSHDYVDGHLGKGHCRWSCRWEGRALAKSRGERRAGPASSLCAGAGARGESRQDPPTPHPQVFPGIHLQDPEKDGESEQGPLATGRCAWARAPWSGPHGPGAMRKAPDCRLLSRSLRSPFWAEPPPRGPGVRGGRRPDPRPPLPLRSG